MNFNWLTFFILFLGWPLAITRDLHHGSIAWYHWIYYPTTLGYTIWAGWTLATLVRKRRKCADCMHANNGMCGKFVKLDKPAKEWLHDPNAGFLKNAYTCEEMRKTDCGPTATYFIRRRFSDATK